MVVLLIPKAGDARITRDAPTPADPPSVSSLHVQLRSRYCWLNSSTAVLDRVTVYEF